MIFVPLKGLWIIDKAQGKYKITLERREGDRMVLYFRVPAAIEQPQMDQIVYDLSQAETITWDGAIDTTGGKKMMPLTRGGWS